MNHQSDKDFFLNELHQLPRHVRLHCYIQQTATTEFWRPIRQKREILSDDQRASLIMAPHVIISADTKSEFATFFINAPHGAIQFDNLTINNLNDTNASSQSFTFTTNAELSQYLNERAMAGPNKNKIRISGRLCGDLAHSANCSHVSNIMFTFECSLSPSIINELDYTMELTSSARTNEAKDNLSDSEKVHEVELKRHQSSEAMFKAREEKRLTEEQPELDWRQLNRMSEKQFNDLSSKQLAVLEEEYQQHIARCDQHDLLVKQRWLARVHMNSPNIRTVMMSVDDATVRIAATLKMTVDESADIPLVGKFCSSDRASSAKHISSHISFSMNIFSMPSKDSAEFKKVSSDVCEFFHHRKALEYQLSKHFDVRISTLEDFIVKWEIDSFNTKMILISVSKFDEILKLWDDCRLSEYLYNISVKSQDGEDRTPERTARFNLEMTWQQFEAPPALWELRDKAEKYHPDPDSSVVVDADNNCRVDYFIVSDHDFSKHPVIFVRRYSGGDDENSYSEKVSLAFATTASVGYTMELTLPADPRIAPFIYDKFVNHHQTLINLFEQRAKHEENLMKEKIPMTHNINNNNNNTTAPPLLTTMTNLSSLQSTINKYCPGVQFNPELPVNVFSNIQFINNKMQYSTTEIHGKILMTNGLIANLSYLEYYFGKLHIYFDETVTLTIPQFLHAFNLSHLIKHFPSLLIDQVRLSYCSFQIDQAESERPTIFVHARTGFNHSDNFMLLQMNLVTDGNAPSDERELARNMTLIKLHDTKLINSKNVSALKNFGLTRTRHCFVYYDGEQKVEAMNSLNEKLNNFRWDRKISGLCQLPMHTTLPLGSHFLTVEQRTSAIWTPALPPHASDETDEKSQHAQIANSSSNYNIINKESKSGAKLINARPIFNFPTALINDHRFSTHLAHYLLNFLPINTIIFTLRNISRAHRASELLCDNDWWKRRLCHDYGSSVTRWSDSTLYQWRLEWLTGGTLTPLRRYEDRTNRAATNENVRAMVESQPIWFSAAIHLQTRLNRFSRDIMKDQEPEIFVGYEIPSALRYVLLVAPPFQYSSKYLLPQYKLWSERFRVYDYKYFNQANGNNGAFWFSSVDDNSGYFGIYTGVCYVKSDQNTANMGIAVEREENKEIAENLLGILIKSEIENGNLENLLSDDEKKAYIREVEFKDSNLFPIIEWRLNIDNQLSMVANSAHEFCVKYGVYRFCERLAQMWNDRELALTIQSTKPMKDEEDVHGSEDDDDDEMKVADENERKTVYNHFSPPFNVEFDEISMDDVMQCIDAEINNRKS